MKKTGLNELRAQYLAFFERKSHLVHPSFPLLPQGDNSLLLINSGMAPLKPYFTGDVTPPNRRMTTCQKCIRTPDIERVGKTSRHGTFFEMLGNFSFGDYFKREAIAWSWEFVTKEIQIPLDKLYITVYLDDDEAYDIWTKEIGVDPAHVSRLGKADNFWEIGQGPCGPCSEIYFDRGIAHGCGDGACAPGCECDRFVEFWNLVFTQYYNDGNNNYSDLATKNIDTGMGLERLACIVQNAESLFDVDTVMQITHHVSQVAGVSYGKSAKEDVSLRIITDHIRSTTFLICDGILPSNEGRGYVLRRLLRRAARHGKLLGVNEPFLYKIADTVIAQSRAAYPELAEKQDYIRKMIRLEEENFAKTIDAGVRIVDEMLAELSNVGKTELSGENAFKLYDTYGFPIDLTEEILQESGKSVDRAGFETCMQAQRERARAATAALGDAGWESLDLGLGRDVVTAFCADKPKMDVTVLALIADSAPCDVLAEGQEAVIVLDSTPFYAESGGQVADLGTISTVNAVFEVRDVQKTKDGKVLHSGTMKTGQIKKGDTVTAEIDEPRRRAIVRAHSAAHLLQQALREVLGSHVEQAGSLVTPDRVRFDFTHFSAMTADELRAVDKALNAQILADLPIEIFETSMNEAKKLGAMALFGEKYGDVVRVVRMGDYSTELCGGTHLTNTAKIGAFRLVSEFSIASGVRRVEAVVGEKALDLHAEQSQMLQEVAAQIKTTPLELPGRLRQMITEMKTMRKSLEAFAQSQIKIEAQTLLQDATLLSDLRLITAKSDGGNAGSLRNLGMALKERGDNVVAVLCAITDGKLTFLAVCGKDAVAAGVRAGDIIKHVTAICGGSGGGKSDSAMGGGKDVAKADEALDSVAAFIQEKTKG